MLSSLCLATVLAQAAAPVPAFAQEAFERAETNAGTLRLSLTNYGTIGKPNVRNNPEDGASMRYPADTGTEHLFEAGIWLGAYLNGSELRVSTSAVTNSSGYATGKAGFEFTADREIRFEGEETGLGVSEQDILLEFSDRRTSIATGTSFIPIGGHTSPMYADVRVESYNWGFPFTENFTILRYDITNNSQIHSGNDAGFTWDSVYVGMYADLVVRNVNSTLDVGSNFFNKNGLGYLDSLYTTYVFDAGSNDNPSLNTYGGLSILGAEYRGEFLHPSNREYLESRGLRVPDVRPSYWLFANGAGIFSRPIDDIARYQKMSVPFPIDGRANDGTSIRDALREDGQSSLGNYITFLSIGPFSRVEPGETLTVYMAFSAALKPDEFQGMAGKRVDDEITREPFVRSLTSMYRVFQGEDVNGNGVLDAGEDVNGNSRLDRYLFPTPPDAPAMRVELSPGRAVLYWDDSAERSVDQVSGEQDFEGYRIYRSEVGDDLNPRPRLIQEVDLKGNAFGFNTGLDAVRLPEPVTFPDDPVTYRYAYELDGLLSGWQYVLGVTAFDRGSETFGISALESSVNANAVRVFPGAAPNTGFSSGSEENRVGVYPNPYRVNAAWDGISQDTRKLYFTNLPARAAIRIYTLSGDIVAEFRHTADRTDPAAAESRDIRWYDAFSDEPRIQAGGERGWDLQSESNQNITTGLYLFTVKDLDGGGIQTGKFVVIK